MLDSTIENWKNAHSEKHPQTDDITVVGVKFVDSITNLIFLKCNLSRNQ